VLRSTRGNDRSPPQYEQHRQYQGLEGSPIEHRREVIARASWWVRVRERASSANPPSPDLLWANLNRSSPGSTCTSGGGGEISSRTRSKIRQTSRRATGRVIPPAVPWATRRPGSRLPVDNALGHCVVQKKKQGTMYYLHKTAPVPTAPEMCATMSPAGSLQSYT